MALLDDLVPDQGPLAAQAEAVRAVLLAERTAKDLGHWAVMAAAFAADSCVRVSWFEGSGTQFVASARARADRGGITSFHEIGAVAVVVNGRRALADASCAVHIRIPAAGVEVDLVSRGRLCWRVEESDGRWRIVSMDMVYLRDGMTPVEPGVAVPRLPVPERPRTSYGFLQRVMTAAGYPVSPELPGVDRPDLVDVLLAGHGRWLRDGGLR
ncbi:nuclear transport factor 2 family protein [Pseudonocardia sp. ICBG1293]|uniref:nuclear transport factor 2 family protein n=1 Tax=Pseudonocardia sp. ICBG1293 TaxID=2844382 RepID=UPI001CCF201E|nr:nuclear transport factor 2 family protein [Pseudonocardia sp. ICBG1293]